MEIDIQLSIITFIISVISYFVYQKFFLKHKLIDQITERSSHFVKSTRSGGVAIFTSLFLISLYYYLINKEIFDFSLLVPLSLLLVVGLYDDIYKLDFKLKFIFQIIAAKIIIDSGLVIDNLHGVLGVFELNRILAQILTMFIIVSFLNAINFIDGIDGLAISVVILFLFLVEFFSSNTTDFIVLTTFIIFSLIPLYYFNYRKKNKIFLGDSGSLFLGGLVSIYVIYILSQEYIIKENYDLHKIIFVMSLLIYPIVDIARIVFLRIIDGKSPFEADKNHIHHLLIAKVRSHLTSTIIIISVSIIFMTLVQVLIN